jgi:hypothetical protein
MGMGAKSALSRLLFALLGALGQRLHRIPAAHELLTTASQAHYLPLIMAGPAQQCFHGCLCGILLAISRCIAVGRHASLAVCAIMAAGQCIALTCGQLVSVSIGLRLGAHH